jgi:hypothetical protein
VWLLVQPTRLRYATQMEVGIAELLLEHGQPLEVVAYAILHGDADAAM